MEKEGAPRSRTVSAPERGTRDPESHRIDATMTTTLRAEAASFVPPSSAAAALPAGRLKAGTRPPPGLPPPPGLEDLGGGIGAIAAAAKAVAESRCGEDADNLEGLKGASRGVESPASTMVPPSPWCSPLMGFQDAALQELGGGGAFNSSLSPLMMPSLAPGSLPWIGTDPEASGHDLWSFELNEEGDSDNNMEGFDSEFKLEGLNHLESSLANLLGDVVKPTSGGGTNSPGERGDEASTHGGSEGAETPPVLDVSSELPSSPQGAPSSADCSLSEVDQAELPVPDATDVPVASEAMEPEQLLTEPATTAAAVVAAPTGTTKGWSHAPKAAAALPERKEPAVPEALTTVMMKNLPRKCSAEQLQEVLKEKGLLKDIDFLYVPLDLTMKKCNQGHAILNFRTEAAREAFEKAYHGTSLKQAFPGLSGNGKCAVAQAPLQGSDANVLKLQKSGLLLSMLAGTPDWLPRIFDEEGKALDFPSD